MHHWLREVSRQYLLFMVVKYIHGFDVYMGLHKRVLSLERNWEYIILAQTDFWQCQTINIIVLTE
jgi:hypothetical protein